jgi:hypothetical protein
VQGAEDGFQALFVHQSALPAALRDILHPKDGVKSWRGTQAISRPPRLVLERVSPALAQVDGSSGAIGTAVNHAIRDLVPIIADAPADEKTRGREAPVGRADAGERSANLGLLDGAEALDAGPPRWPPREAAIGTPAATPVYNDAVSSPTDDAVSRAAARSAWPVRRYRLGDEPADDLSDSTTPEERLAMMWPLAVEAWSLTGRPFPDFARGDAPVRRIQAKSL